MLTAPKSRDPGFDNLRGILILLVVFGHLLELAPDYPGEFFLRRWIYLFHMPSFLFLAGWFAKFDLRRLMRGLILPYLLFQSLFLLLATGLWGEDVPFRMTEPYYGLWFLLVLLFSTLLIPLVRTESKGRMGLTLLLSLLVALLAGYFPIPGTFLALSRFFAFFPWFLLGYYGRHFAVPLSAWCERRNTPKCFAMGGLALLTLIPLFTLDYDPSMLHAAYPPEGYTPWMRLLLMVLSACWILFLFLLAGGPLARRLPLLTALGQNTLPLYLLHGFVVKSLAAFAPAFPKTLPGALLLTAVLALAFGNPLVGRAFRRLFHR